MKQFYLPLVICLYSVSMSNSFIWLTDRSLSRATTSGQSGPGSDGNKGVVCIQQSSSITGVSPLDCLVSYQDTRSARYSSTEMQLVYSTAPADWVISSLWRHIFSKNHSQYCYSNKPVILWMSKVIPYLDILCKCREQLCSGLPTMTFFMEVALLDQLYETVYSVFIIYIYIYIRGSLNKFPDFFRMGTFIDSTHMKLLSPSN